MIMGFRKQVDKILGWILVVIMAVMVINVLWQVFSRYITGNPSSFTDELARYLMIWVGVLGAAYVSGRNMHVAIDVLPMRAGKKTQRLLFRIVNVFISYILGQHSPALNVPLALVYTVLPLSGLLIIYYKTTDLIYKK